MADDNNMGRGFASGFGGCLGVAVAVVLVVAVVVFFGVQTCAPHIPAAQHDATNSLSEPHALPPAPAPVPICAAVSAATMARFKKIRMLVAKPGRSMFVEGITFCFASSDAHHDYRIGYTTHCLADDAKCVDLISVYDSTADWFLLRGK